MKTSAMKKAIADAATGPVTKTETGTVVQAFKLTEDFLGFQGHFPGYPVLPAVVQILMGQHVAEEWKQTFYKITHVERAKFQSEIRPGDLVFVECKEVDKKGKTYLEVLLRRGGEETSRYLLHPEKEGEG